MAVGVYDKLSRQSDNFCCVAVSEWLESTKSSLAEMVRSDHEGATTIEPGVRGIWAELTTIEPEPSVTTCTIPSVARADFVRKPAGTKRANADIVAMTGPPSRGVTNSIKYASCGCGASLRRIVSSASRHCSNG